MTEWISLSLSVKATALILKVYLFGTRFARYLRLLYILLYMRQYNTYNILL